MTLRLYRALSPFSPLLIRLVLGRRLKRGKEDPKRIAERFGHTSLPRPEGPLVWLHASSVGEAVSALPLIGRVLEGRAGLHLLVTTGSVTSAKIMAERLPPHAFHQYAPADHPAYVRRFLDHWRPDLALWIESEFWPNQLRALQARGVPVVLVNARMSERSYRRWRRWPGAIRPLLETFALILAQNEADARRLEALGAPRAVVSGNLKHDALPLPVDRFALDALEAQVAGRPLWLAASTHPGEEEIAGRTHRKLKEAIPGLLTLVVPRHPNRGEAVAHLLRGMGLAVARRGANEAPTPASDVYLGDTLGEMALYYRLAPVVFVGGSLVPHGGQNPLEPARLGAALLFGPHMRNFAPEAAALLEAKAAIEVADENALAAVLRALLADPARARARGEAALAVARGLCGALDKAMHELEAILRQAVA